MANFTLSCAILDTALKSLPVLTTVVAATRLAFLCKARSQSSHYTMFALWFVVEASVALAAAAVSSYRVVFPDLLCKRNEKTRRERVGGSYRRNSFNSEATMPKESRKLTLSSYEDPQ